MLDNTLLSSMCGVLFIDTSVHAEIHKAGTDYDSNLVSNFIVESTLAMNKLKVRKIE